MDRIYALYLMMHRSRNPLRRRLIHAYLRVVFACDIMPECIIGEGTRFPHNGLGLVIHPAAVIGEACTISQGVTIGGRGGSAVPSIGNGVLVGANAVILGDVHVGDWVKIGASAVVLSDVPPRTTVVGNPARAVNHGE